MAAFLTAHREGIRYLKGHRSETLTMLERVFGYVPDLAAVLYDDYLALLDERLTIDLPQVERLLRMTAPDAGVTVSELASRWLAPGALTPQAHGRRLRVSIIEGRHGSAGGSHSPDGGLRVCVGLGLLAAGTSAIPRRSPPPASPWVCG